jgi:transmembrane sensor
MSSHEFADSADSAKAINATAASWIARSLHENWSERDHEARDAWLAESPLHQIAYWRLQSAWDETYRLAALRSASARENPPASKNTRSMIFKAAAAIMLVAALGSFGVRYYAQANHGAATYSTALGERKLLTLADGSQIELNTNTLIEASIIGTERKIWITRGEAYFHVRHDPARPFVVVADGRRIVDIGTEFVVRRDPDFLHVAVLEGRVGFGDLKSDVSRDLVSGDVATARKDGVSVSRAPLAEIVNELSWRRGKLVFHHTSLADAAAEFNRYNSEKLVIADAAASEITINGTFPTNDVHAFSRLAHAVLGLRVEDRGQAILISQR